jgi:hypothetical protein
MKSLVAVHGLIVVLGSFRMAAPLGAQPSPEGRAASEGEIRAVRVVYQEVTRAAAEERLTRRDSTVECGENDLGSEITVWREPSGRIRQLTWAGGTDDHAQTVRHYYDRAGRLRFVFITRGAVNGTEQEARLYFGEAGQLLRRVEAQKKGPGYPFGDPEFAWRPEEWMRQLCSEGR